MRQVSAVLLVCMLALAGCDSAEERVLEHHERGMTLLEEGVPEKAALEFRNALAIDSNFIPARFEYAKLLLAGGNVQGALEHLLKVIELDPAHSEARLRIANLYLMGGRFEEALTHAEVARKSAPDNVDALLARGTAHYRLGHVEQAVADARKALELRPGSPEAQLLLVSERADAGEPAQALAMADRFLGENPTHLPLNFMKLRLLGESGDNEGVGFQLEQMVTRFPENAALHQLMASWYVRQGRTDEAEAELRKAQDLQPDDVAKTRDLARFLLQTRGEEAARAELVRQIAAADERDAERFPYQEMLVDLDLALGRKDQAKALLEEIVAGEADEASADKARIRLARMAMSEDDLDRARALVDEVIARDARNATALGLRAATRAESGDAEGAVLDLRAALNEAPEDVELLRIAVDVYQLNGNPELAVESLSKAVRLSNADPELVLTYVAFLEAGGQGDAVEAVLTDAVERRPDAPRLLTALGALYLEDRRWAAAREIIGRLRQVDASAADRLQAAALSGQGRTDEAIALLKQLGQGGDASISVASAIVQVYEQGGQRDAAHQFVDDMLSREPRNAEALRLKGILLQADGEAEQALASYIAAIEADPENVGAYLALSRLHQAAGRPEEAEALIEDAVARVPDSPALLLHRSEQLQNKGDFAGAVAALEALHELEPDSVVAVNNLASMLSEHYPNDPDKLERAAELVRSLAGIDSPQIQDTYGWIRYLQGEPAEALRSLIPAARELPDNAWVRYHVGMAYAALDQAEEARENLEAALSLAEGQVFPPASRIQAELDRLSEIR